MMMQMQKEICDTQKEMALVMKGLKEGKATENSKSDEPKNIGSNLKYTLQLPELRDKDKDVEEFIKAMNSQLSQANNGKLSLIHI